MINYTCNGAESYVNSKKTLIKLYTNWHWLGTVADKNLPTDSEPQ